MRGARIDSNQQAVVAALRAHGIAARSLAAVGKGFPDVIAAFRGVNVLLEVKNPGKLNGNAPLSEWQQEFIATWPGPVYIVWTPEEAVRVVVDAARPQAGEPS